MAGERPEARERLGAILSRTPERFAQLVQQDGEDGTQNDLALLLRRLGRPAMEATLSCYKAGEAPLQAKVSALLKAAITGGRPSRTGLPAARIARAGAYVLLDALFEAPMEAALKARLLI